MGETEDERMAQAGVLFENFVQASTCKGTLQAFSILCRQLELDPLDYGSFYSSLKAAVSTWKVKALWAKLDKRAEHKVYNQSRACQGIRVREMPTSGHGGYIKLACLSVGNFYKPQKKNKLKQIHPGWLDSSCRMQLCVTCCGGGSPFCVATRLCISGCEAALGAACRNDLVSEGNDKSARGGKEAGDSRRRD